MYSYIDNCGRQTVTAFRRTSDSGAVEEERSMKDHTTGDNGGFRMRRADRGDQDRNLPWLKPLAGLIVELLALGLAAVLLWQYVGNLYIDHSNSMYPHIKDGDMVVTCKLGGYAAGDAVLFRSASGKSLGRIIAVPGDEIALLRDGSLLVNGADLQERWRDETTPESGDVFYRLDEGEYFVLCDRRESIPDLNTYGVISEEDLRGSVVLILRYRGI